MARQGGGQRAACPRHWGMKLSVTAIAKLARARHARRLKSSADAARRHSQRAHAHCLPSTTSNARSSTRTAMAAAGHALLVACALLCGCATLSRADCPDKDVRCRIANAETKTEVSSSGCEVGGEVDAGFAGDVPAGSVQVSGRCYRSFRDTDGTTFVPMGVMTVGTCYQYHFPDTSIDQSCRPCRSLVDECAGRVAGCRTCPGLCTSSVTAAPGDSCWGLANANGLTLDALLQLNPGLNCEPLAVNQRVCLAMGTGPCTNLCEGRFV